MEAARRGCSLPGPGRGVHRGHLGTCIAEISSTNNWDTSQAFRYLSSVLKNFSLMSVSGVSTGQIGWLPGRSQGDAGKRHTLDDCVFRKMFCVLQSNVNFCLLAALRCIPFFAETDGLLAEAGWLLDHSGALTLPVPNC